MAPSERVRALDQVQVRIVEGEGIVQHRDGNGCAGV
jgi:hypothetical protein